jgi:hypothetical protein
MGGKTQNTPSMMKVGVTGAIKNPWHTKQGVQSNVTLTNVRMQFNGTVILWVILETVTNPLLMST